MNPSDQDYLLWRAAVDEAGHVIAGRRLGITILSAVIDLSGVCETNVDFSTVQTVEVASKLRLAGLAALMVMKCFIPEDAEQPDFVTTKQYLVGRLVELGLSEQAAALRAEEDMQRWLTEVRATLSAPASRLALERCAKYIFENSRLEGDSVDKIIDGFFDTSPT